MLQEHNHQFEVEEDSINSDSSRHMSSPMSMPMTKNPEATVVVVPEKRRRFTAQEKVELVRLSYLPGNTVSSVARQYGVALPLASIGQGWRISCGSNWRKYGSRIQVR